MAPLLVALLLAQEPGCAAIAAANASADVFDVRGALEQLEAAPKGECPSAQGQATYLRAWIAARDAYRAGGSPESLKSVDAAVAALNASGERVAAYVLQAAAAAAQSERDTMSLLLEQAIQLESIQLSASLPGAPVISAHEAAGELWLQVYRYEDARRAFQRAAERLGPTRRITLGLARAAVRLEDVAEACRQYRTLVAAWTVGQDPQEVTEARRFLREPGCTSGGK